MNVWVKGLVVVGGGVLFLKLLNESKRYRQAVMDVKNTAFPTNNVGGNLLPKPVESAGVPQSAPVNQDALAFVNPFTEYGDGYMG